MISPNEAQKLVSEDGWLFGNDIVIWPEQLPQLIPLQSRTIKDLNVMETVGYDHKLIIKTVMSGFERLEDRTQMLVFETIYKLERRPQVVDFSALDENNFEKAYGHRWPTEEQIVQDISTELSPEELKSALGAMRKSDILAEASGRWRIRV